MFRPYHLPALIWIGPPGRVDVSRYVLTVDSMDPNLQLWPLFLMLDQTRDRITYNTPDVRPP